MGYLQLVSSNSLRVILAILAVYRLVRLFQMDDGPWNVIKMARENAVIRSSDSKLWEAIAELYNCPYCLGIWFAALGVALLIQPTAAGDLFLLWLGLAGAQFFLESR